jgi:serine/threonine protein kinase
MRADGGTSPEIGGALWHWSRQLASALLTCHEVAGVYHRDIKPENMIVGMKDELVLIDFGLSKKFDIAR